MMYYVGACALMVFGLLLAVSPLVLVPGMLFALAGHLGEFTIPHWPLMVFELLFLAYCIGIAVCQWFCARPRYRWATIWWRQVSCALVSAFVLEALYQVYTMVSAYPWTSLPCLGVSAIGICGLSGFLHGGRRSR